VKVSFDRLAEDIPTPCIAHWKNQHFVVVYHVNRDYAWIADPSTKGIYLQSKESFQDGWLCDDNQDAGVLLLFETTPRFFDSKTKRNKENPKKLELTM
ncbi:MAG TPA: peptidase domain-containing ABC transporter, partial [Phaeodactylibacter sp.]|nr:peptidase domain-containing ABC transporter [Phaeodactylibacter sp.]